MAKNQMEEAEFFDDELDEEGDLHQLPLKVITDVALAGTDWTVSAIADLLRRGTIDLAPVFQRRFAWTEKKKSRFIESLYMGLPIPQIVLAEETKGKFIVIDGKQRLLTIKEFVLENKLILKDLEFFEKLNGKSHEDIKEDPSLAEYQDAFETTTIRCVLIKNWQDERLLYLTFLRLNTGSVQLSPQELRKALHPGKFLNYLDSFCEKTSIFEEYFKFERPDFRMRDVEIILRFIGFALFSKYYKGNMKDFLDHTARSLNKQWNSHEETVTERMSQLEASFITTKKIFGKNTFRKWNGKAYENRPNRAVIDIMTYYFSDKKIAQAAEKKAAAVETAFKNLCNKDRDFKTALETTTKSIEATEIRFEKWAKALSSVLKIKVKTAVIGE